MTTTVRDRERQAVLAFDGGPWLAGRPLARTSPWAELVVGALVGALLGGWLLPDVAVVRWLGWIGWVPLAPRAAVATLTVWVLTGTWSWLLGPEALGVLGWGVVGLAAADLVQAVAPWPFTRRLVAAGIGGPALAAALIAGPWLAWTRLVGA